MQMVLMVLTVYAKGIDGADKSNERGKIDSMFTATATKREEINVAICFDWSGREDLNLRPHAPHACTLPGCATPRGREL